MSSGCAIGQPYPTGRGIHHHDIGLLIFADILAEPLIRPTPIQRYPHPLLQTSIQPLIPPCPTYQNPHRHGRIHLTPTTHEHQPSSSRRPTENRSRDTESKRDRSEGVCKWQPSPRRDQVLHAVSVDVEGRVCKSATDVIRHIISVEFEIEFMAFCPFSQNG